MGKKSRSGSGMNIPVHISERLETIFWVKVLTFFDADADVDVDADQDQDPESGIFLTQDPGWTSHIRNTALICKHTQPVCLLGAIIVSLLARTRPFLKIKRVQ
jgi:hypothetical protein